MLLLQQLVTFKHWQLHILTLWGKDWSTNHARQANSVVTHINILLHLADALYVDLAHLQWYLCKRLSVVDYRRKDTFLMHCNKKGKCGEFYIFVHISNKAVSMISFWFHKILNSYFFFCPDVRHQNCSNKCTKTNTDNIAMANQALKRRPHQAAENFDLLPQRITDLPHDFASLGSRNLGERERNWTRTERGFSWGI